VKLEPDRYHTGSPTLTHLRLNLPSNLLHPTKKPSQAKPGNMITIQIKRNIRLPVNKSILVHAAQLALEMTETDNKSDLSIIIGNDALLHQLNLKYRQVDSATDVLSFPSGEVDPDTSDLYLGDIVISLPRAEEQASTEGHSLADELQLLVVHGTLHLLGHDHAEVKDKKMMQLAQDHILKQLGLNLSNPL
jgi:probable rRNA maturation factor